MSALAPFQPPLGPQPPTGQIYKPHETTLKMTENVWSISGDDFTVKTVDGEEICKCKGRAVSMRDRKKFTDTSGNELFTVKNKMIAISKSFHGKSPSGHDFEIRGHIKLMGSRSTVDFKNASDGSNIELEVKGDWIDRKAEITYKGQPVALLRRKFFNARELFTSKDTVCVIIITSTSMQSSNNELTIILSTSSLWHLTWILA